MEKLNEQYLISVGHAFGGFTDDNGSLGFLDGTGVLKFKIGVGNKIIDLIGDEIEVWQICREVVHIADFNDKYPLNTRLNKALARLLDLGLVVFVSSDHPGGYDNFMDLTPMRQGICTEERGKVQFRGGGFIHISETWTFLWEICDGRNTVRDMLNEYVIKTGPLEEGDTRYVVLIIKELLEYNLAVLNSFK